MAKIRLTALCAVLAVAGLAACRDGAVKKSAAAAASQTTTAAPAATTAASSAAGTVTGTVAETMNAGAYSYVRLQTAKGDVWIAASEFPVKAGERLTAPLEMPMENFHSKTLNRDFPLIYFVSQVARDGEAVPASARQGQPAQPAMMGSHQPTAAPLEPVQRAPGGLSIAEVWARRASLSGKPVVIRGRVVKVNNGILDRNWLHLQDGSGSDADHTNDLTVTTDADVKIGDIVTASGVVGIGKDFGAGYAYDVILEKAIVK